jgi:hypothetical protein
LYPQVNRPNTSSRWRLRMHQVTDSKITALQRVANAKKHI